MVGVVVVVVVREKRGKVRRKGAGVGHRFVTGKGKRTKIWGSKERPGNRLNIVERR